MSRGRNRERRILPVGSGGISGVDHMVRGGRCSSSRGETRPREDSSGGRRRHLHCLCLLQTTLILADVRLFACPENQTHVLSIQRVACLQIVEQVLVLGCTLG